MSDGAAASLVIDSEYSIRASSEVADIPKLVLKHDDAFLVADRLGDVPAFPDGVRVLCPPAFSSGSSCISTDSGRCCRRYSVSHREIQASGRGRPHLTVFDGRLY
jgi:hypothetical protein